MDYARTVRALYGSADVPPHVLENRSQRDLVRAEFSTSADGTIRIDLVQD
jgi:hypothetical protein